MSQIKNKEWCRRGESNPRPRDYETLALPLSYAGRTQFFMLRIGLRMCQGAVFVGNLSGRVGLLEKVLASSRSKPQHTD